MGQVADALANPVGLDGVSFIEFAGPDPEHFAKLFLAYGFQKIGQIPGRKIELYRQGQINYIVNSEPGTFAETFWKAHGPSVCSTGFRVKEAAKALQVAVSRGGKEYQGTAAQKGATPFPAIFGIGESLVYFVDAENFRQLEQNFQLPTPSPEVPGIGFTLVDHFTNNVPVGEMQKWCDFYTKVFNFRETRYFDIRGKSTGLISKVMRSPCNQFAVPINEPSDDKSQIQEYLDEYKGSGIQHIALLCPRIIETLEELRLRKLEFLSTPPETYYRTLKDRLPMVSEDLERLRHNGILVDGDHEGYLLQIFSKNIIGPIFFEVIQRKGHSGFGEGNFQALFDAIEQDQRERGYI